MRCLPLLLCGFLAGVTCVTAAPQTAGAPEADHAAPVRTVFLNKLALEELKKSNPRHYKKAQQVLAQGEALCAPGVWQRFRVLDLPPATCAGSLLRTSNPPKREVSFRLEDTRYVAYVTVRDVQARMHRLGTNPAQ